MAISRRKLGWVLAIALVLLLPALWNRYPLLYPDSAEYLLGASTLRPPRFRTAGYCIWIWSTGGTLTLWAPVVAQALLVSALLVRTLIAAGVELTWRVMLAVVAALLLTGAPWIASEVMADVFAGALLLATWLALAHWQRLGSASRAMVVATILIGVATHVTMPVIFGALLLLIVVARRSRHAALPTVRTTAAVAGLVAFSTAALATFNWARTDRPALTQTPSVFVLGHLVETGLAARILDERCAVESFRLCPYRDGLTRPIESFIWVAGSPLGLAHHSEEELRDETRHMLRAIVVHEPLRLAWSVLAYGARQFVDVELFDASHTGPADANTRAVVAYVLPNERSAMMSARQQRGDLAPGVVDALILAVFIISLVLSALALRAAFRRGPVTLGSDAGLQLYLWSALVVNAFLCANLSGVFGRYQSRLAWLLPVLVAAMLPARRNDFQVRSVRPGE